MPSATIASTRKPRRQDASRPDVTPLPEGRQGPASAATDCIRNYADQIRDYVPMRYTKLGTDGYGRSAPHQPVQALRGRPPLDRAGRDRGVGGGGEDDGLGRGAGDQAVQARHRQVQPDHRLTRLYPLSRLRGEAARLRPIGSRADERPNASVRAGAQSGARVRAPLFPM